MTLTKHTIGITTEKVVESRDFYVKHFGFKVVFDNGWYTHLRNESNGMEIAFLQPNHPTQDAVFQAAYNGSGLWLALEVDDVDSEYERLRSELPIEVHIKNEPWGERHFAVLDPNGIGVNVMKMMNVAEPAMAG
jgi:catechol 2,3-dioxygenase-like lactoylglutathione lyase family enzyme